MPWPEAIGLGAFGAGIFVLVTSLPLPARSGRAMGALHVFLTLHLVVLSRIFFRAPDLETARAYVAGLLAFDLHGIRPGLTSPWVWAALVFGMMYHFTPRSWIDQPLVGAFRRVPGAALGLGFVTLCFGLMKLLEGAPCAFIYFQF